MTTPKKDQNWQKRQYDSYGPHFRIETANPELGTSGNVAYNFYGYSDSGDTSNVGMMGSGQYQIFADQCISIKGGANVEGGGTCINIIGSKGDVCITALDNGDVRIRGKNIILDADENIEMTAGGKVEIDSTEILATTQNKTTIKAQKTSITGDNINVGGKTGITLITPKGPIYVKNIVAREVSWASQVFQGTPALASLGGYGGGTGNPTNRRGSGV